MENIISFDQVRDLLWLLNQAGLTELSNQSGVSKVALLSIKHGQRKDVMLETVRAFAPKLAPLVVNPAYQSRQVKESIANAKASSVNPKPC